MSKMRKLQNVEKIVEVREHLREPITRWLNGEIRPSDREIMIEIVDSMLPHDQILWPPWVMINIHEGHITLSAHILDITAQA